MAVSSLLEDYLLVFFFFSAWYILMIIVPYFFNCLGVKDNQAYQILFFLGILTILSIIIKILQNGEEECRKKEEEKRWKKCVNS